MSGFINSLINRFNGISNVITPRLHARFESSPNAQVNPVDGLSTESMVMTPERIPQQEQTAPVQTIQ